MKSVIGASLLREVWVGAGVVAATLGLYVATLAPGLTWQNDAADGGELSAAAWTLGVAHPPGYPVYLLLSRGFVSLFPGLEAAYRFNLFSAVSATLAVLLTFLLVARLLRTLAPGIREGGRLAVAALSALSLATSPVLWSQATVAEVYALNGLFFVAILLLSRSLLGRPRPYNQDLEAGEPVGEDVRPLRDGVWGDRLRRWAAPGAAALLLGLGLGNHATLVILGAVLAVLYVTRGLERLDRRRQPSRLHPDPRPASRSQSLGEALGLLGLLALGLAVYAYIPFRAAAHPPINWGQGDAWEGFIWLVTAQAYRGLVFGVEWADLPERFASWAGLLVRQFTVLGLVPGLMGAWTLYDRWPRLLAATGALFLGYSVYAGGYNTADSYVYLIPVYVVFTVWIAVGWIRLLELAGDWLESRRIDLSWGWWAIVGLAVVVPAFNVAANYDELDLSRYSEAREFVADVVDEAEPGALVLASSDRHVFGLWYWRFVEEPESSTLVVASRLLQFDWYWTGLQHRYPGQMPEGDPGSLGRRLQVLLERSVGSRPVYFTYWDNLAAREYNLVDEGRLWRAETDGG